MIDGEPGPGANNIKKVDDILTKPIEEIGGIYKKAGWRTIETTDNLKSAKTVTEVEVKNLKEKTEYLNDVKQIYEAGQKGNRTFESIEQTDEFKAPSISPEHKTAQEAMDAKGAGTRDIDGIKTFEEIENADDIGGVLKRNEWRKNDPGAKYDAWIKGAGPHSKLGKTYRELQAKVREASKTQFVPRAMKDMASTPLPTITQTNK